MNTVLLHEKDVDVMIQTLISSVANSGVKFNKIVGIANGGLNISKPMAKFFDVPHESIKISCYSDGPFSASPPIIDMGGFNNGSQDFLLVDDLIDSGQTLRIFKEQTRLIQGKDFHVATLHWNPSRKYWQKPDFFVEEKINTWIVYPWEVEE